MDQRQQARGAALQQASQLRTALMQLIPVADAQYETQRQGTNHIIGLLRREKVPVWPVLQAVVFSDINETDQCVISLNEWNTVLREVMEMLQTAQIRLEDVELKKFQAYSAIQEFIYEVHKVICRCIFRLGELSPPQAH